MDALTHAIIGVAVGGFSGHAISIHDPVYIASVLGSQAPDFDIVTRLGGPMSFLRHHRAFSHSLPGLIMWSALITGAFYLFSPTASSVDIFLWSLVGGLTHIIMDFLNTHGTAILWPFRQERKSCNLLNVFDPVLLALLLSLHAYRLPAQDLAAASMSIIAIYVGIRRLLKQRATTWLRAHFGEDTVLAILVMPCLTRIFYWDFLVKTGDVYYIGRIPAFYPTMVIHTELPARTSSALSLQAQKTAIGRFFSTFTPFSYFEEREEDNEATVRIYDLRYYSKARFIHSGTIVFKEDKVPAHAYIQSYGDKINIQC